MLEKFIAAREEKDEPKLPEIGSCNLHIVSGSLNAGVNASGKLMKLWKECGKSFRLSCLKGHAPEESISRRITTMILCYMMGSKWGYCRNGLLLPIGVLLPLLNTSWHCVEVKDQKTNHFTN